MGQKTLQEASCLPHHDLIVTEIEQISCNEEREESLSEYFLAQVIFNMRPCPGCLFSPFVHLLLSGDSVSIVHSK